MCIDDRIFTGLTFLDKWKHERQREPSSATPERSIRRIMACCLRTLPIPRCIGWVCTYCCLPPGLIIVDLFRSILPKYMATPCRF
jgi:hypothetical protein